MKVYLTLSEMKIIRDALYQNRTGLERGLEEHQAAESKVVREVVEEGLGSIGKLILYFNDKIQEEDK